MKASKSNKKVNSNFAVNSNAKSPFFRKDGQGDFFAENKNSDPPFFQSKYKYGQGKRIQSKSDHSHGCSCGTCSGLQMKHDENVSIPSSTIQLKSNHEVGCGCDACSSLQMKKNDNITTTSTSVIIQRQEDPKFSESNSILGDLETTGAGSATKKQDGLTNLTGVEASEKMAETDSTRIKGYAQVFIEVGNDQGLPPALLAAIASRESRGGNALASDGTGDKGNGFGIMQVDKRHHEIEGEYDSKEHVTQAAGILKGYLKQVKKKHSDWTESQQLRGAVAAYNFGAKNVQTLGKLDIGTTGDDYSADVWARARYYASLEAFKDGKKNELIKDESQKKLGFMEQIAYDVYQAIKGMGTDEVLLIEALSRLNNNQGKIEEFTKVFNASYSYNPIEWIISELSSTELEVAKNLLNINDKLNFRKETEKTSATIKVKSTLNVRSNPDSSTDNIVRKLKNNEIVNVIKEKDGWLQIGKNEWISKEYAEVKTEKTEEIDTEALEQLAELVNSTMEGMGTYEYDLYNYLSRLRSDLELIKKFKLVYFNKYKVNLEDQLRNELSDSSYFGDELKIALQILTGKKTDNGKEGEKNEDLAGYTIKYGSSANKSKVTAKAENIIKKAMKKANLKSIVITSTARTAKDQARAMYNNIVSKGVASQKKLYGLYGDKVIDEYVKLKKEGKTATEIKKGMTDKINSIGPPKVSRHCADFSKTIVVDIGPNSSGIPTKKEAQPFLNALEELIKEGDISLILTPWNSKDPAIHVEIPNN